MKVTILFIFLILLGTDETAALLLPTCRSLLETSTYVIYIINSLVNLAKGHVHTLSSNSVSPKTAHEKPPLLETCVAVFSRKCDDFNSRAKS